MQYSSGIKAVREWFGSCGWTPFSIQDEVWRAVVAGNSGFLYAPPGSGKTSALLFAAFIQYLNDPLAEEHHTGLRLVWITPRRNQTTELRELLQESAEVFDIHWSVAVRGGDNLASIKKRQRRHSPHALVTTPENLHILLSEPGYSRAFEPLRLVVIDDWHELSGTKAGVQTELALARIQHIAPQSLVWSASAHGNPDSLLQALPALGAHCSVVMQSAADGSDVLEEASDYFGEYREPDRSTIFRVVETEARQQILDTEVPELPVFPVAFDVLVQYCLTLACSDGFTAEELYREITATSAFRQLMRQDFDRALDFIVHGSVSHVGVCCKVQNHNGLYRVTDPATALRHRMQIGTVDDTPAGHLQGPEIREPWIAIASPEGVTATALWTGREEKKLIPPVLNAVRQIIGEVGAGAEYNDDAIAGAFSAQQSVSAIPGAGELLIESVMTSAGHHLFLYPFEGMNAHKHLAVLLAWRIVQQQQATIHIAAHDYGFELLADVRLPIERFVQSDILSGYGLADDRPSIDLDEPARHRFRAIAHLAGIATETGKNKQQGESLTDADHIFEVWKRYDRRNVLLQQAYSEVQQWFPDDKQLRTVLDRIVERELVITHPKQLSPFALALRAGW